MFAETWGTRPEMQAHPIGVALNGSQKYLASNSLVLFNKFGKTLLSELTREEASRPLGYLSSPSGSTSADRKPRSGQGISVYLMKRNEGPRSISAHGGSRTPGHVVSRTLATAGIC
jgi:hypothetical protein